MSGTRCDAFNGLLLPYGAVALWSVLAAPAPRADLLVLATLTAGCSAAHLYYGASVVSAC